MCVWGFGLACGGFWSSVVVAGYEKRTTRVLPLVVLLCLRVVAAVCYSPTLFRVQYHCRAGS